MTILIVEDDRPLNDGMALSLNGAKTLQAYNLKEARTLIDDKIDLIILDSNLPDGSGLDFCKEIRSFGSVPIIFLTANDLELDIVAGLAADSAGKGFYQGIDQRYFPSDQNSGGKYPALYQRFYRSEQAAQEKGVGVGLYLTREILRKQGGYIKVRSKPLQGSSLGRR